MKYRYELNLREPCDWKGVENHLQKMAAGGWRLDRIANFVWRYRRDAPAQVRYAVAYLPALTESTPRPDPDERALTDLCEAAGWQKVDDWNGMLIYANDRPDPQPFATDEPLRLESIHATMRRRWLRGQILFLVLSALISLFGWPIWAIAAHFAPVTTALLAVCLFGYPLCSIACYYLWYAAARLAVANGRLCPSNSVQQWVSASFAVVLLATVALYLVGSQTSEPGLAWYIVLHLAGILVLNVLCALLRRWMRERSVSQGVNLAVTLVFAFVTSLLLVLGLQSVFLW